MNLSAVWDLIDSYDYQDTHLLRFFDLLKVLSVTYFSCPGSLIVKIFDKSH